MSFDISTRTLELLLQRVITPLEHRLATLEAKLDKQAQEVRHIRDEVDLLNDWHHEVNGALRLLKWALPLVVGVGSIVTAVLVEIIK